MNSETKKIIANAIAGEILAEKTMLDCILAKGLLLPKGMEFKDENGNVINATKIVLEKKKKDVSLTQEQINTMVHDSCVLFCKHCGCGIPRDTCTSLGTCKEHDEYRATMRAYLMEKKKKEYPKTYEECAKVLLDRASVRNDFGYKGELLVALQKLLVCRDAYWKIAGEEMGLGKPWEPDYDSGVDKFGIVYFDNTIMRTGALHRWERHLNKVLEFPTEEMRDAFYENFKELIESVKELL